MASHLVTPNTQLLADTHVIHRLVTPNTQLQADTHVSHRLVTPNIQLPNRHVKTETRIGNNWLHLGLRVLLKMFLIWRKDVHFSNFLFLHTQHVLANSQCWSNAVWIHSNNYSNCVRIITR